MSFRLPYQIPRAALFYKKSYNLNNYFIQKCQKIDTKKLSYLALKSNIKKVNIKGSKRHPDMVSREKSTVPNRDSTFKKLCNPLKTSVVVNRRSSNRNSNNKSSSPDDYEHNDDNKYLTPLERFLKKYNNELKEMKDYPKEEKARLNSLLMRKEHKCDEEERHQELNWKETLPTIDDCVPCHTERSPTTEGGRISSPTKIYDDSEMLYPETCETVCSSPPPRADDLETRKPQGKLQSLDDFSNHSFKNKAVRPGMFCEKIRIMKQRCNDEEYIVYPPAGRYDETLIGMKVKPFEEGYCCFEPCEGEEIHKENDDDFYNESYRDRQRRTDRKKCINAFGLQCMDPCLPKLLKKYDDSMMIYEHQDEKDLRLRRLRPRYKPNTDTKILEKAKKCFDLCNIDPPRMDDITCWEPLPKKLPKLSSKVGVRNYSTYTIREKTLMSNFFNSAHVIRKKNVNSQINCKKSLHSQPNLNKYYKKASLENITLEKDILNMKEIKNSKRNKKEIYKYTKRSSSNVGGGNKFKIVQNITDGNIKFVRCFATKTPNNKGLTILKDSEEKKQAKHNNMFNKHYHTKSKLLLHLNDLQPCKAAGYASFSDVNIFPSLKTGAEPIEERFHKYHFDKENINTQKLTNRNYKYYLKQDLADDKINLARKESEHELTHNENDDLPCAEKPVTQLRQMNDNLKPKNKQVKKSISEKIKSYMLPKIMRRGFSTSSMFSTGNKDETRKCGKLKKMFYVNPTTRKLNLKNGAEIQQINNPALGNIPHLHIKVVNRNRSEPYQNQPKSHKFKKMSKASHNPTRNQSEPYMKQSKTYQTKSKAYKKRKEIRAKEKKSEANARSSKKDLNRYELPISSIKKDQNRSEVESKHESSPQKLDQYQYKSSPNQLDKENSLETEKGTEKNRMNTDQAKLSKKSNSLDMEEKLFDKKNIPLEMQQNRSKSKENLIKKEKEKTDKNRTINQKDSDEIKMEGNKIKTSQKQANLYKEHLEKHLKRFEMNKKDLENSKKRYEMNQKQMEKTHHRSGARASKKHLKPTYFDIQQFDIIQNRIKMNDKIEENQLDNNQIKTTGQRLNYTMHKKEYKEPSNEHEKRLNEYDKRSNEYEKRSNEYEKRSNEYEKRSNAYENRSNAYENRSNAYENRSNAYENRSNAYENRRNQYEKSDEPLESYPYESNKNQNILKSFKLKKDTEKKSKYHFVKKFPFKPENVVKLNEDQNEPNLLTPNKSILDESSIKASLKIINDKLEELPQRELEQENYIRTSKIPKLKKSANVYMTKNNNNAVVQEIKLDDGTQTETDPTHSMDSISSINKFGKYAHINISPSQYLSKKIKDTRDKQKQKKAQKMKDNKVYAKKILLKKIKKMQNQNSRKYSTHSENVPEKITNKIDDIEKNLLKVKKIHKKIIDEIESEKVDEDDQMEVKSKTAENLQEINENKTDLLINTYAKQIDEALKNIKQLKTETLNETSEKTKHGYNDLSPDGKNLKWDEKGEDANLIRNLANDQRKGVETKIQQKKMQTRTLANKYTSCDYKVKKPKCMDDCKFIEEECCSKLEKPPKFVVKKKKRPTLLMKIVNYFKARPNCPTPQELRRKRLLNKAKHAADAAGLDVCLKKKHQGKIYKKKSKKCCCEDVGKRYHSTYVGKNKLPVTSPPDISSQNFLLYPQRNVYVGKMYEVKLSKIGVKNALIPRKLDDEPYTYCQICKFVPRDIAHPVNGKNQLNNKHLSIDEEAKRSTTNK